MKRISFFLAAALFALPAAVRAQDPAVEERLNKLSAQIQDLIDAKDAQNKRIEELARQLRDLQEAQNKPNVNYASQEDLKVLASKLQEIDRKRQDDNELIVKQIRDLGKAISGASRVPPPSRNTEEVPATIPKQGYEYTIQSGDSLSAIAKAYSEKGVKITVEQILKANPGLKPERMKVGQKIFIPAAQ